jgi:hypothetical protein
MQKFKLIVPLIILFASCKKANIEPLAIATKGEGYITVTCDNCQVGYGMPDQYKSFNVVTTSPKATFTYTTGYILQVYVTALDHEQKLTLNVFNSAGKSVYSNSITQPITGYWGSSILIPAD